MNDYYKQIQGWFDFADIYDMVIERADPEKTNMFVEVGCWKGKSFCYMCQQILKSEKYIFLTAIDSWKGEEGAQSQLAAEAGGHDNVYQEFLRHRREAGYEEFTHVIRKPSIEAVRDFKDQALDFVFIDACHQFADVKSDILAWLPKMKPGSIIGGHDYNSDGVERAVKEIFGSNFKVSNVSWWTEVK